ncbi:Serine/threonine-protein kinase WNK (With No Lysine)-related [Striga hermonthica]|uniref:Serine/threonine-protein kinase WNK (With No Lysine)-related n=1 Tax=Striga hermonthica TaxID=68872 RepID=A0A9N7R6W3_STRHE|nr:Serine/threonine-protein kinase WNK (With No Lysine)-related [Striga hermonthica]
MEEQLSSSLSVTHLLQHTLRSLCIHDNSQWVYAVFWRILPRNYPPPKWDSQGGVYERSRGVRRNWILVWEDGFCNFAASSTAEINAAAGKESTVYENCNNNYNNQQYSSQVGLQPELFFKMSHEIYNFGEGLIGKVAADHGHKWIHKEPNDEEINFLSAWHNSPDSQPRTWEAQFQSGIKTIALIAVREGVIQLGAVHKVIEDLSYVVLLRKKWSYIESIPGVLLPHPSSSSSSLAYHQFNHHPQEPPNWHNNNFQPHPHNYFDHFAPHTPMKMITPSMSSLDALLSKLPSVMPSSSSVGPAKEENIEDDENAGHCHHFGYHHHDLNVINSHDMDNI